MSLLSENGKINSIMPMTSNDADCTLGRHLYPSEVNVMESYNKFIYDPKPKKNVLPGNSLPLIDNSVSPIHETFDQISKRMLCQPNYTNLGPKNPWRFNQSWSKKSMGVSPTVNTSWSSLRKKSGEANETFQHSTSQLNCNVSLLPNSAADNKDFSHDHSAIDDYETFANGMSIIQKSISSYLRTTTEPEPVVSCSSTSPIDTVDNYMGLHTPSSSTNYPRSEISPLPPNFHTTYSGEPHRNMWCTFCMKNKETFEVCYSHQLKDAFGRIACPILRAYCCPICKNKGGDFAHTIKYCPLIAYKPEKQPINKLLSTPRNSTKIRK